MSHHELKIQQEFKEAKDKGLKDWECRLNDRGYEVGDTVRFGRDSDNVYEITFILLYFIGLQEDYVIFSHRKLTGDELTFWKFDNNDFELGIWRG